MREETHSVEGVPGKAFMAKERKDALLAIALAWIGARKARDGALGAELFVDPAWDILLELYIDYLRGRKSAVTKICLASTAPLTTGLRWVAALEAQNLVRRQPDSQDRRRTFLILTPTGLQGMEQALDGAAASDARLGLGRLRLVQ